jgi:hypothetical protein
MYELNLDFFLNKLKRTWMGISARLSSCFLKKIDIDELGMEEAKFNPKKGEAHITRITNKNHYQVDCFK